jgi:hypothetical protein
MKLGCKLRVRLESSALLPGHCVIKQRFSLVRRITLLLRQVLNWVPCLQLDRVEREATYKAGPGKENAVSILMRYGVFHFTALGASFTLLLPVITTRVVRGSQEVSCGLVVLAIAVMATSSSVRYNSGWRACHFWGSGRC